MLIPMKAILNFEKIINGNEKDQCTRGTGNSHSAVCANSRFPCTAGCLQSKGKE